MQIKLCSSDLCSNNAGERLCMGEQIPLNSQLTIDLELVSWRNVIDVLGDKKIMKKIIKNGEGFDRPNQGSLVKGNLLTISASFYCISFRRKNPKTIYI